VSCHHGPRGAAVQSAVEGMAFERACVESCSRQVEVAGGAQGGDCIGEGAQCRRVLKHLVANIRSGPRGLRAQGHVATTQFKRESSECKEVCLKDLCVL